MNMLHEKPPMDSLEQALLAYAIHYVRKGLFVIPLCWPVWKEEENRWGCGCGQCKREKDIGKRPLLGSGYQHERATREQVEQWWHTYPLANIGILLEPSGLLVADLDGLEAVAEAERLGLHPVSRVASTGKGLHYYYRKPAECQAGRTLQRGYSRSIDLLAAGYIVAPPSRHRSGELYRWLAESPTEEAPAWMLHVLEQRSWRKEGATNDEQTTLEWGDSQPWRLSEETEMFLSQGESLRPEERDFLSGWNSDDEEELRIREALSCVEAESYQTWLYVGMALHHWDQCGTGRGRGKTLWDLWSQECPSKYHHHEQQKKWSSFDATRGITLGTLFELAKAHEESCGSLTITGASKALQGDLRRLDETVGAEERRIGSLRLDCRKRQAFTDDLDLGLTPTEFMLFERLVSQAGEAVLYQELLALFIAPAQVHCPNSKERLKRHIYNLRRKLECTLESRSNVHNVRGIGYLFLPF